MDRMESKEVEQHRFVYSVVDIFKLFKCHQHTAQTDHHAILC